MAMCAGVRNASRPIERCQEISQCTPTVADVADNTESQMYQDTEAVRVMVAADEDSKGSPGNGTLAAISFFGIPQEPTSSPQWRWRNSRCASGPRVCSGHSPPP